MSSANVNNKQEEQFNAEYNTLRKSGIKAFLLCLFLGGFGTHLFYLKIYKKAILRAGLFAVSLIINIFNPLGYVVILALTFWAWIDLFLIPKRVKNYNNAVKEQINSKLIQKATEDEISSVNKNWIAKSTGDVQFDLEMTEAKKILDEIALLRVQVKSSAVQQTCAEICNAIAEIRKQTLQNSEYAPMVRDVWKTILPDILDCLKKYCETESVTIQSAHIEAEKHERETALNNLKKKVIDKLDTIYFRRLNDSKVDIKMSESNL